jgi:hypothetical protein
MNKMKQMGHDEKDAKFRCDACDYNTSHRGRYNRHILTDKHISRTNETKKDQHIVSQTLSHYMCEKCKISFNSRTTMWRHTKKCNGSNVTCNSNDKHKEDIENLTNLVTKLITQNSELVKTIKDIAPIIGSNNNNTTNNNINKTKNFNIQLFLNETCKDAINLSEFVDSLKITMDDLAYSRKNGLVRGITDVMINGLKKLDVTKRPIHCTDTKRDTMYIKDNAKWEKDEWHEKMRNTIIKIATKERNALIDWVEENPNWMETETKQIEYLTIMRNVCEPIEHDDKNNKKIIHNITSNVFVDKGL